MTRLIYQITTLARGDIYIHTHILQYVYYDDVIRICTNIEEQSVVIIQRGFLRNTGAVLLNTTLRYTTIHPP